MCSWPLIISFQCTDHLEALLSKTRCNFIFLFCFIVDMVSPKLLNLDQVIVAYKVIVFKIKRTYFFMQLIPAYLSYFFLNSFFQRTIN